MTLVASPNLTAIEDAVEDWLESRAAAGRTPKTLLIYRWTLETFIKRTGITTLEAINAQLVERYLLELQGRGNSSATAKGFFRTMRAFIGWAKTRGRTIDPSLVGDGWNGKRFALEMPRGEDPPKAIFSKEELATVRRVTSDGKYGLFIKLLSKTGLRLHEALSITAQDIITVNTRGDDAPAMLMIRKTKSRKARSVPLTRDVYFALQRVARHTPDGEPLFSSLSENSVGHACERLSKQLGFHVNPHKFRHTFGTMLMVATKNPELVRQVMGHEDYKTMQIYMHAQGLQLGVGWERLLR